MSPKRIIQCNGTNLQLHLGTTNKPSAIRVIVFHVLYIAIMFLYFFVQSKQDECVKMTPLFDLNETNISTIDNLKCSSPRFIECLCSLPFDRTIDLDKCDPNFYGAFCQPVLLLWLLVAFLVIRELFTLVGRSSRTIVHSVYIFSFFCYVFLGILFYQGNCFHRFFTATLPIIFMPFRLMALHDTQHISRHYTDPSPPTHPDTSYRICLAQTRNQVKPWHEIL